MSRLGAQIIICTEGSQPRRGMLYPELSLAVGTVLGSTAAAMLTRALAESGRTEPGKKPVAGQ